MNLGPEQFPLGEVMPLDQIGDAYRQVTVSPEGHPELAFNFSLPNDWQEDRTSIAPISDGSNWTPLAIFGPTSNADQPDADAPPKNWAMATVLWRKLNFEVTLEEWVAWQMNFLCVEIKTYRLWNDGVTSVYDVGGIGTAAINAAGGQQPASVPLVARVMVRSDGQDVFAILAMATEDTYATCSRDIMITGATLRLQRQPKGSAEGFRRAVASNPAFEVFYPASWAQHILPQIASAPGRSALNLTLVDGQNFKGLVQIKALDTAIIRALNPDVLTSDATAELAASGISLQGTWAPQGDEILLRTPGLQRALIAPATANNTPVEVQFAIVSRPPLVFCISAIIAPPSVEPVTCMRAHKTYAVALLSARPI